MQTRKPYSLCLVLAIYCQLPASPPKLFISKFTPQVCGISLGSTLNQARTKFGKNPKVDGPHKDKDDPCGTGPWMDLQYQGLSLSLNRFPGSKNFTIVRMKVTHSRWVFDSDLRVGMSFDEVQKLFPSLKVQRAPDGSQFFWDEPVPGPGGFEIHFTDNVVDYINLFLELC